MTEAKPERVAKLMARRGLCSRREAERLIEAGEVLVDGVVVSEQGCKAAPDADIRLAGRGQRWMEQRLTVLLHKPRGVVSTQPEGPQIPAWTLLDSAHAAGGCDPDLVARVARSAPQFSVAGRLDRDSSGLLVLTTDGRVVRAITGSHSIVKRYQVRVEGRIDRNTLTILNGPLSLDDEPLAPMQVERIGDDGLAFALREGRKHQIRRVCQHCGLRVRELVRIAVGPWQLGDLGEGRWRPVEGEALRALGA
jgi:23S rRNA pseudouridine2604 synthase